MSKARKFIESTLKEGKTDFLGKIKQEISGYEDNGGGLHLFVKEGGKLYAFSGFEYSKGSMLDALKNLANGGKAVRWDNPDEDPKQLLRDLNKPYAARLIFDNDGFYFDDMRGNGNREFKSLK